MTLPIRKLRVIIFYWSHDNSLSFGLMIDYVKVYQFSPVENSPLDDYEQASLSLIVICKGKSLLELRVATFFCD